MFFVALIRAAELEFGRRSYDGYVHGEVAVGGSGAIFRQVWSAYRQMSQDWMERRRGVSSVRVVDPTVFLVLADIGFTVGRALVPSKRR